MKMAPLLVALATLLVVVSAEAQSSRWVEVGGDDQTTAYIDVQSMRRIGPKVKVWVKWVNTSPMDTTSIYPKKTYLSEKGLSVYHCDDRTSAALQVIRYASADTQDVVESLSAPDSSSRYQELAPETIGESILEYACKATTKHKK